METSQAKSNHHLQENKSKRGLMGIVTVIYDTFADFGSHTTIGGLCNAGLTESRGRQACWLIIFTILSGFTIQSLVGVVQTYLQYDVITSTDLTYSTQLNT
jgi:hypothetical protein